MGVLRPWRLSRTRVASCRGSGRSRPPSLSVQSARWYVACGNSFGRSLHPCARPHARRNEAPPSAALAPHSPALWRGRPTRLWGRGRCIRDHHLACPRSGLLPRRGFVVERAWVQVVREAVGPEGPRRPSPPRLRCLRSNEQRRSFVLRRNSRLPLYSRWPPREGVALVAARRRKVARYPELTRGGPQRLVVRTAEVGGHWSDACQQFLRTLLRLRVQRASPPLRAAAAQGWARRWWSVRSVALQRAVASSALGVWTMPPLPGAPDALPLGDLLDLAIASAPSRLPLR